MDASPHKDTIILGLLQAGDVRGAASELVRGYADDVYALCSSMTRDRTLAEDMSQEVFTRAFRSLKGFRGDASVRTWILRIARNRCIDQLRAQRREPWQDAVEPDGQPADEPSVADLMSRRADVQAGLAALDETERALVVLRFGHGLGYAELADAFGLRQGAVRMRVSRAVARMRAAIVRAERGGVVREAVAGAVPAPAPRVPAPQAPSAPGAPPPAASPAFRRGAPTPAPSRRGRVASPAAPRSAFSRVAPQGLRSQLDALADAIC